MKTIYPQIQEVQQNKVKPHKSIIKLLDTSNKDEILKAFRTKQNKHITYRGTKIEILLISH